MSDSVFREITRLPSPVHRVQESASSPIFNLVESTYRCSWCHAEWTCIEEELGTLGLSSHPVNSCLWVRAFEVVARSTNREVCLCAAIRFDDGLIIRGHRHADCMRTAYNQTPRPIGHPEQGFLTTLGRFVDRQDGLHLQQAAGIDSVRGGYQQELYSEDLY